MTSRSMLRRTIAATTIATAALAATQTAAAGEQSAIVCPIGYVCLQPTSAPTARPILVKEGDRRTFQGGLQVSAVSNRTSLNYCVAARPFSYGLAPVREVVQDHVVLAVGPGQFCPTWVGEDRFPKE